VLEPFYPQSLLLSLQDPIGRSLFDFSWHPHVNEKSAHNGRSAYSIDEAFTDSHTRPGRELAQSEDGPFLSFLP
jgi:hypothetical protein